MDQAVERLAEVGFEDTVYDDAIMAQEAVEVSPVIVPTPTEQISSEQNRTHFEVLKPNKSRAARREARPTEDAPSSWSRT
jgi:hypothetical protein